MSWLPLLTAWPFWVWLGGIAAALIMIHVSRQRIREEQEKRQARAAQREIAERERLRRERVVMRRRSRPAASPKPISRPSRGSGVARRWRP